MNAIKTTLGYLITTVGAPLAIGWLLLHGYGATEAVTIGSAVATVGGRLLQQAAPPGKAVYPR